ncbi:hypothetical protein HN873_001238 [Arachis hypogaea]
MELLLFPHSLTSIQPPPTTVVVAASNFEQPPPAPSLPFLRAANVANFLPSIAQPPFDHRSIHRAATVPPCQLCSTALPSAASALFRRMALPSKCCWSDYSLEFPSSHVCLEGEWLWLLALLFNFVLVTGSV